MTHAGHALTPLVRQYQQIKAAHPDAILLFRIGDFYETFGDDARLASELLNITLTRKHVGKGRTLPLAGIPYHALNHYLAKLIRAGQRVAICEQTEDPKHARGVVRREVVRVVTPGTVIEEALLDDKAGNFIAAVARAQGVWGLAYAELSTGQLRAAMFSGDDARGALMDELARIAPAEALLTEDDKALLEPLWREVWGGAGPLRTRLDPAPRWDDARRTLLDHFGVASLDAFDAEDAPAAVCAAGALIDYLRRTQRQGLGHLRTLDIDSPRQTMRLDAATQRSLELTCNLIDGGRHATLLAVLDHTRTPMGGRLLRQWVLQPLQDLHAIRDRQDAIADLVRDGPALARLREGLRGVRDLERLLGRIHCQAAGARDLVALGASLRAVPAVRDTIAALAAARWRALAERIDPLAPLADLIERAFVPEPPAQTREGGMIRDGFDAQLDELRAIIRDGRGWIARLRAAEIERTGIGSLKIGFNRVFGYYIEVSKAHLGKVPADYIRRQTLAGGERFVTPELKAAEEKILGAEEKIVARELELFEQVRREVIAHTEPIQTLAALLAEADALASLAEAAARGGYVRPEVDDSDVLDIRGGRHPVLETLLHDRPFVPNDVHLDRAREQIWLITGPNMAGKSTFIRQVALLTLMAHIGSFVPAQAARIGRVDRIFTRVGATDYLARGQSTFLVEMTETANILRHATDRSLVILDEIGRGTSTYDGLAIAWAVVEYLHDRPGRRPRTLFATHYHELTELQGRLERVRNYNVAVRESSDAITFLYRIEPGHADRSYGIYAAQLAGMPAETLQRAQQILFQLECRPTGDGEAEAAPRREPPRWTPAPGRDVDVMQLDLFAPQAPPWLDALAELDINSLTPLQAMQKLAELIEAARQWRAS